MKNPTINGIELIKGQKYKIKNSLHNPCVYFGCIHEITEDFDNVYIFLDCEGDVISLYNDDLYNLLERVIEGYVLFNKIMNALHKPSIYPSLEEAKIALNASMDSETRQKMKILKVGEIDM